MADLLRHFHFHQNELSVDVASFGSLFASFHSGLVVDSGNSFRQPMDKKKVKRQKISGSSDPTDSDAGKYQEPSSGILRVNVMLELDKPKKILKEKILRRLIQTRYVN